MFWRQTRKAPSLSSPSTTRAAGTWLAMASPRHPEPAHRSRTRIPGRTPNSGAAEDADGSCE